MSGIRISEKHGVNPSLIKCFFCGEDKGIALLGKLKGDAQAPMSGVFDYEPCDKCKAIMDQGVTIFEADTKPFRDNQPPFDGNNNYISGRYVVIKREAVNADLNGQNRAFMLPGEFQELCDEYKKDKDDADREETTEENDI